MKRYVERCEEPSHLVSVEEEKFSGGAVDHHSAVVVKPFGIDQQILSEVISWRHDIFAPEASIVLNLNLSIDQYVEPSEF